MLTQDEGKPSSLFNLSERIELGRKRGNGWVNQANVGDIDWAATAYRRDEFDHARFWELYVEGQKPESDADKALVGGTSYKPDYFRRSYGTKENYVKAMHAFTTHAVITMDGKWHETVEMGWFGPCAEVDGAAAKWALSYWDTFLKDLPADTLISVVDCHA
jgi:hypothetical protein